MAVGVLSTLSDKIAPIYLLVAAVFVWPVWCILRAIFDPLRDIPGPFLARFTRLWYVRNVHQGHNEQTEIELHQKYGPIVRIAPGQYSFSDPSVLKVLYDHGSKFPKTDFYYPFGSPDVDSVNVFQEQDIEKHAKKRRALAQLYSMTSIVSYEPFVDSCIRTFIDRLDQFAKESTAIDLPSWMQYYAFDVIGAISIGEPYGFMNHGHDFPGIIQEMHNSQAYSSHVGAFAGSWHKYISAIMSRIGTRPPFLATQQYAERSLAKKETDLRAGKSVQETTGKQDFAEKLLSLREQGRIDHSDLIGSLRANVAAGSDTTGVTLSAIMYYLLRNPNVLAKLRHEIDTMAVNSPDSDDLLTFTQTQQMPYLQSIIKESLRLHPAVGMQLPRTVPPPGTTLLSRFFPSGTTVGVNAWVLHHNTAVFGHDAHVFRPERWLDEDSGRVREMDRCMLAFGAGARVCMGRNISLLEMQKLVPEVVRRFELALVDEGTEWVSCNRFFVKKRYGCWVRRRDGVESV